MKKLWALGLGLVVLGCPCGLGCTEAAETWAWGAALNIVASVLESLGTLGGGV